MPINNILHYRVIAYETIQILRQHCMCIRSHGETCVSVEKKRKKELVVLKHFISVQAQ